MTSENRGRSRKHKLSCYRADSQDITSDGTCSNRGQPAFFFLLKIIFLGFKETRLIYVWLLIVSILLHDYN